LIKEQKTIKKNGKGKAGQSEVTGTPLDPRLRGGFVAGACACAHGTVSTRGYGKERGETQSSR